MSSDSKARGGRSGNHAASQPDAGVITAGILVAVTGSHVPDLVVGVIIGLVVLNGARRILLLR